jgi:hypothetical protein
VQLKKSGRRTIELMREYDITKTSINQWVR